MLKAELMKKLYEIGAIKFGNFHLKFRKRSPYYVDLRILPSYPKVLDLVGVAMTEMIEELPKEPDKLCGIPTAGLAITYSVSNKTGIPAMYIRKEPIVYKDLVKHLKVLLKDGKYKLPEESFPTIDKRIKLQIFESGVKSAIETIDSLKGFKVHGIARVVDGIIKDSDNIHLVDDLITSGSSDLEGRDLVYFEAEKRKIKVNVTDVDVLIDREQGGFETLEEEGIKLNSVVTIREAAKILYDSGTINQEMYDIVVGYTIQQRKEMSLD